jgi:hypothetical protein
MGMTLKCPKFPVCDELTQEALKLKHRHSRAMAMKNYRIVAQTENQATKLHAKIDAVQQLTHAHLDAQKLACVVDARIESSMPGSWTDIFLAEQAPQPTRKPELRRSYTLDTWTERKLPKFATEA